MAAKQKQHPVRRKMERPLVILFQDEFFSGLASLLSILAIRWISDPLPGFSGVVALWVGTALVAGGIGMYLSGFNRVIPRLATVRSIGRGMVAVLVKELALLVLILSGLFTLPAKAYYVLLLFMDSSLTVLFLVIQRMLARYYSADSQESSILRKGSRTALVYGTGDPAIEMAHNLEKEGYEVVGLLTTDKNIEGRVIADYVVYASSSEEDLRQLQWKLGGVDGLFFPHREKLPEGENIQAEIPQVDGMTKAGQVVKRSFDVLLSGVLLLLFSPVMLLCAIAIKKEDGGKAIYAQQRIGKGGKPFFIYKFRSMRPDAESAGVPELYAGDDDARLTHTGHFLRVHHLDELPQLWNVFIGDMSFIGYRPEREYYIQRIMRRNTRYRYLYQIQPGVTSYATLHNGYTDTMDKMLTRLDLDLYYLRNRTLWFDVKVLGLTFLSIVTGKKF